MDFPLAVLEALDVRKSSSKYLKLRCILGTRYVHFSTGYRSMVFAVRGAAKVLWDAVGDAADTILGWNPVKAAL